MKRTSDLNCLRSILSQSEVKVESSDLGECHETAHDEEHLLLSPFFFRQQVVPPLAALASNPTHSNDFEYYYVEKAQ